VKKFSNTVYIIDDDLAMSESLSWLLSAAHLKVEFYKNALDFLEAYQLSWQGCMLIDVRMPGMSGLQLQEKLIEMGNTMPCIMVSGHADVEMAVRALKASAKDFITKPYNDQVLLEKIQNVLVLNKTQENKAEVEQNYKMLTTREQQVMKKIVDGKTNKNVASELNLSSKTVELHRANLMQKMEAKNLACLIKMHYLLKGIEIKN
jgi:two-component system response regulator FixJ